MHTDEKNYFLGTLLAPIFRELHLKHQLVGGMRRVPEGASSDHHDIDVLITLRDEDVSLKGRAKFMPHLYRDAILRALVQGNHVIHKLTGGISTLSGE
jgi:hypothetical protein